MEILTNFPDVKAIVPENDEILFIDYSISSTFRSCEDKSRLSFVRHLQPRKPALPLIFGSAMHKAIEVFHNNIGLGSKEALRLGIVAMNKNLEEHPDQMPRFIRNSDDEKRSVERCQMLFAAYTQRWAEELFITKHIEIGFAIDLNIKYKNKSIVYVGRVDRVVEKFTSHDIYNIETKTTGMGLSYFMEQKKPNHQVTGYNIALIELMGIKPEATVWDAIFVSTRKPDQKKGGWFEYGIDIDKDFDRQETRRSPTDISEWYYDIRRDALRYFEYRDSDSPRWSRNDKMCHSYGGCQFRGICESNLNEAFIASEYSIKEWKPWEGIVEKKIETT